MSRASVPDSEVRFCAAGLDIGGTKTAGGVVELPQGNIVVRRKRPTRPERPGPEVLADAVDLARELTAYAAQQGLRVQAIGVGIPELVDPSGAVTSASRLAWRGLPVRESFSSLLPTVVEADVRAAALAESMFGAGKPYRLFVYITVGTGISHCLVHEGRPYAGARGNAELFASSPRTTICDHCGKVLRPILEDISSGPAMVARYNRIARSPGAERAEDLIAAAGRQDETAIGVVRAAGEALGVGVGWLIDVLDPEAVVVGGGLGLCGGLYWESLVCAAREQTWADNSRDLPILPAALGSDSGWLGAAAGAWLRYEPPPAAILGR